MRRLGLIAVASVALAATASIASANHSVFERISASDVGSNGVYDAAFKGVSDDGTRVFFATDEAIAVGDHDNRIDVYQRFDGVTSLISRGQINGNLLRQATFDDASADGTKVFFSTSEPLVTGDTDTQDDIYERSGGTTKRVSVGQVNGNGNFLAFFAGASDDGTRVLINTFEPLVASDTDTNRDVYERSGGTTKLISAGQINGSGPFDAPLGGASSDGTRVVFQSDESLVASDTDASTDVYERSNGTTKLVSAGQINGNGAFDAGYSGVSTDGARVFFSTSEPLVAADTDSASDLYERSGGTTQLVSAGQINGNGNFLGIFAGASATGTRVFFVTVEPLVAGDTDTMFDIYERSGGTTKRVSAGAINGSGPFTAQFAGASDDGAHVFFTTSEQLVANDTDSAQDLYDRSGGATKRVSVGQINGNGNLGSLFHGASVAGTRVFFSTDEQLVPNDTDTSQDIYERFAGATTRISNGQINGNGAFPAAFGGASPAGADVFFQSSEPLEPDDLDAQQDVYSASVP